MLNRIKVLCLITLSLAVSTATFADTVTVRKDGSGNFLTIQDALESLDYNNGVDDTVIIGPGIYDQQITANGDAGADSVRYPNIFNMSTATVQAAFGSHTDNLTLQGEDPNDPPVLTYITGVDKTQQPYGLFPNDPSDFFEASIVHCGNNVTYENVEIRHGAIEYCQNGMSTNTVYEDCLFTMGLPAGAGHDAHFNINNNIEVTSAVDASIGADCGYTWNNCIWDGASTDDGSLHDGDGLYFHGFDSVPGDGQIQNFLQLGGCAVSGSIMRNWDSTMFIPRGREQKDRGVAYLTFEDCFSENLGGPMAIMEGAVEFGKVNRCVHKTSGFDDSFVRLEERSQGVYQDVVISNNIVSGTNTSRTMRVNTQSNAGTVLQTANYVIVNNTFYGHTGAAIGTDGPAEAAGNSITVLIANNLFHGDGSGTAIGINHTAAGGTFTLSTNGFFGNGGGDVTGGLTNSGAVTGDPAYAGGVTTVTIPADTGGPVPLQGLNPTNVAYLDAGTQAAYDAVRADAGDFDVDQSNTTLSGIDIGAQQNLPISVLDWSVY